MRNLFPNIESAIIIVGLIGVALFGLNKCRTNTTNAMLKSVPVETTTTSQIRGDSSNLTPSISPAAVKPRTRPISPVVTSIPSTIPDNYSTSGMPNSTVPMVTTYPQQQQPQQQIITSAPQSIRVVPNNQANITSKSVPDSYNTAPSSGTVLYVLIDGMHIRSAANLKSKSMGRLRNNDFVYFMNEVTDTPECVHLANGKEVCKPWFKIKTKHGTVGWVHGSGVDFYKRKPTDNL